MLTDIIKIVTKFIPDADKAKQFEAEISKAYNTSLNTAVKADKDIKLAELKRGGIAAIWRPIGALMVFATLAFHWLIYPIIQLVLDLTKSEILIMALDPLPIEFYGLAIAFISIYAHGRSLEKRYM